MTPKPLIALFGKMRAGKDTVGAEIHRLSGVPTAKLAQPIYLACEVLGIQGKDREALQNIATFLTNRNDDHFVKLFFDRLGDAHKFTGVVVTDGRRSVEYAFFKAAGFLCVRLDVSRETQIARGAEPTRLDHPTETALDNLPARGWDAFIPEGGSPKEAAEYILRLWHQRHGDPTPTPPAAADLIPDYGTMERERVMSVTVPPHLQGGQIYN